MITCSQVTSCKQHMSIFLLVTVSTTSLALPRNVPTFKVATCNLSCNLSWSGSLMTVSECPDLTFFLPCSGPSLTVPALFTQFRCERVSTITLLLEQDFLQLYALTNVNLLQIRGECFFSDTTTSVFIVTPSSCITSLVCMFFTSRVSASVSKFSFFTSFLILRSSSFSSYAVTPVREA